MDYNTNRSEMKLPEYGRNIHKMVAHIKTIKDKDLRNTAAHTLISIMGDMNPHLRDAPDFKHKLWDHLAIMADFDLNIDWPYPLPDVKELNHPPEKIPYSENKIALRFYGKNLERMLQKVKDYEGKERDVFILQLANQMKKSYTQWKNEAVNDEVIFKDLEKLSEGAITLTNDTKLNEVKKTKPSNRSKRKRNYRKSNYNNHKN